MDIDMIDSDLAEELKNLNDYKIGVSENSQNASMPENPSEAEDCRLERIKFSSLMKFKNKTKRDVLQWFMDCGLISSYYICPKCINFMQLKPKECSDGYIWRCRGSGHQLARTVRTGTIFRNSRLNLIDLLMNIHCWVYKIPTEWITLEMDFSYTTILEWGDFCRSVCVEICARDDQKIGGDSKIVEIIGGKLETQKYRKVAIKESFVFAGVEDMYGEKYFIRLVEKCDKKNYLETIKNSLLPGTTIISEFCATYDCTEDEDFVSLGMHYSYDFENCDVSKEGFWESIRKRISIHHATKDGYFDKHLGEFLWRKKYSGAYDKMRKFLIAVKTLFPPAYEDD